MPTRSALIYALAVCGLVCVAGGCNRRAKIPVTPASVNVLDVDFQIKQLDSKLPAERATAIQWLQKCDKGEAQRAIPKLKQVAAKDKNEGIRKMAEYSIKMIQGG